MEEGKERVKEEERQKQEEQAIKKGETSSVKGGSLRKKLRVDFTIFVNCG